MGLWVYGFMGFCGLYCGGGGGEPRGRSIQGGTRGTHDQELEGVELYVSSQNVLSPTPFGCKGQKGMSLKFGH